MERCAKHPDYTGKKRPTKRCWACLRIYINRPKHRAPVKPTRVMRDRSKYTRKKKHKNYED